MQLLITHTSWSRQGVVTQNNVQINSYLNFDNATIYGIVKLDSFPGTPMAHLSTAEQRIFILNASPGQGVKSRGMVTSDHTKLHP